MFKLLLPILLTLVSAATAQTYTVAGVNVTAISSDEPLKDSWPYSNGTATAFLSVPGTYEGSGGPDICAATGHAWSVSDPGWLVETDENGVACVSKSYHYIRQITAITRANPAVVSTNGAHRWNTGDKVTLYSTGFSSVDGERTITRIDSTRFSVGVSSAGEGTAYNDTTDPGRASFDNCYQRSAVGAINLEGVCVDAFMSADFGLVLEEKNNDSMLHKFYLNGSNKGHFSASIDISGIIGDGVGNNGPEGVAFYPGGANAGGEAGVVLIAKQAGAVIYVVRIDTDSATTTTLTSIGSFTPIAGRSDIGAIYLRDEILWVSYDANDTLAAFRYSGGTSATLIKEWGTRAAASGFPYATIEGLRLSDDCANLIVMQDGPSNGSNANAMIVIPDWAHGSICPAVQTWTSGDKDLIWFAEPEPGYIVDHWYIDGTEQSGQTGLEFSHTPSASSTVTVSFKPE